MILIAGYLLWHELGNTVLDPTKTELVFAELKVDHHHQMEDLEVQIDIDMLRLPCELIDLRFIARRNREHVIQRLYITKDGQVEMTRERSIEEIDKALDEGEGCKIKGNFFKHFIVNNFHIAIGNEQVALHLMRLKGIQAYDLSHKINSLTFGNSKSHQFYARYKIFYLASILFKASTNFRV